MPKDPRIELFRRYYAGEPPLAIADDLCICRSWALEQLGLKVHAGYIQPIEKYRKPPKSMATRNNGDKPVKCIDKFGEMVGTYPSIKQAAAATNTTASGISLCLSGKHKTSGGYRWEYEDEENV